MNTSHQTSKQLLDSVWQSLHKKDLKQAIDCSNQLGRKFPDFAAGWHATSYVAQHIKQPKSALIAINRALKLEPENVDWQLQRVSCLLLCGDDESGNKLILRLLAASKSYTPAQLSRLAFLCNRVDLHAEAARLYQRLTDLEPNNGGHWYNLASMQRFRGQITRAETSLEKAIKLNPEDYEAYELRSDLRRQTSKSNHIFQLNKLLERGIKMPAGEVRVCYALAKELEDTGAAEQSFRALSRGAALRRKHINYNIDDDLQTINSIIDNFDQCLLASAQNGYSTAEPIFIIGLPRSGTTLVERILGSHSNVFAAGEMNNFAVQMQQQAHQQVSTHNLSRLELVRQSAKIDFEHLGKAYIDSSRSRTGSTAHFVDKMPLNFLYAGLIHLALPEAKIIHLTRQPMDACYAIYKRLFQDAYPWSYDLGEIAAYYLAYRRLMKHWNQVMPDVIHELAYEDLVTDFEARSRKLINFCNLPWESQCLHFAESSAISTTASATQVRQAIYTTSVSRWRDYESQLQPLADMLRKGGILGSE